MTTGAGIRVNGAARRFKGRTVADLLRQEGVDSEGRFLAVAVNGAVVRRAEWATAPIAAGDEVEIVKPVSGG